MTFSLKGLTSNIVSLTVIFNPATVNTEISISTISVNWQNTTVYNDKVYF